jgi:hypothetical protein
MIVQGKDVGQFGEYDGKSCVVLGNSRAGGLVCLDNIDPDRFYEVSVFDKGDGRRSIKVSDAAPL